jgi:hypothetical protein
MPIKADGPSNEALSKYLLMILTSSEVKETRTGQLKIGTSTWGPVGSFFILIQLGGSNQE